MISSRFPKLIYAIGAFQAPLISFGIALCGILQILVCLEACRHGIDFTDEGYYLNSISNPWLENYSLTQFGFIYYPLWQVTEGNVALIRQINLLLTVGLSWLSSYLLIRETIAIRYSDCKWMTLHALLLGLGLSSTVLVYLQAWRPTPSYNTLALQALLLATSGLILAGTISSFAHTAAGFLLGAAGWFALMGKPSTAALLAVVVIIFLCTTRNMRRRIVLIGALTCAALTLVSSYAIDGSPCRFAARLLGGLDLAIEMQQTVIEGGSLIGSLFRRLLPIFNPNRLEIYVFVIITATVLAMLLVAFHRSIALEFVNSILVMAMLVATGVVLTGIFQPPFSFGIFRGLWLGAVLLGTTLGAIIVPRLYTVQPVNRQSLFMGIFFAFFPLVYVFGSLGQNWVLVPRAGFFWLLAAVAIVGAPNKRFTNFSWSATAIVVAAGQLVSGILIQISMDNPYRQPEPLRRQQHSIARPDSASMLFVSASVAAYVNKLQEAGRRNGLGRPTQLLDLTGRFPGTLFWLGADYVGRAWMIGGYPWSNEVAKQCLDRVPPEALRQAWLLLEPEGPRKLQASALLERYGISLDRDYRLVAKTKSPKCMNDYWGEFEQYLMKPRTPETSDFSSPDVQK